MRLIWAERAELDLYEIADRYATVAPGLDDIILERIETAPLLLLDHPQLGPPSGLIDLRKWPVRRTPFVLLYRIVEDAVEIARVVHGMSDWQALD